MMFGPSLAVDLCALGLICLFSKRPLNKRKLQIESIEACHHHVLLPGSYDCTCQLFPCCVECNQSQPGSSTWFFPDKVEGPEM
jgi:hypothetical protein